MPRSFLKVGLPPAAELGHGPQRGGLGGLAAGVGVDLGIQHQDVDVAPGGEDVVHAAVADVVGPAVTADDPDTALDQLLADPLQGAGLGACDALELLLEGGDALALLVDPRLGGLIRAQQPVGQVGADLVRQGAHQVAALIRLLVHRQAQAQAELGVVLEQGVVPGRASPLRVHRVGGGGQVAAVDGGAAGGIGDQHAVAEELGGELDVGGLAAAHAGPGELEQGLQDHGVLDLGLPSRLRRSYSGSLRKKSQLARSCSW